MRAPKKTGGIGVVPEGPCHLGETEVGVGELEGPRHRTLDEVRRHICEPVVGSQSESTSILVPRIRRVLEQAFIGDVDIEVAHVLRPSIGEDDLGLGAGHAAPISRTRPLGKPPTLAVGVDQSLQDRVPTGGEQEEVERQMCAVGVPKAEVGDHGTGVNAAVIGAEVDDPAMGVDFMPGSREQQAAVEAGVEHGATLV
ncbi:MAG: hypothetical protein VCF24_24355 [Candidatus Latescibacterota bacterium]